MQMISMMEKLEDRRLLSGFTQTNLVSDGFLSAAHTDADLKNPWGVAFSSAGPFWVSDNGTSKATVYDSTGAKQSIVVNIPGAGGEDSEPTGQVFNSSSHFVVSKGGLSGPATFIFAGEDGGITGWNGT